MDLLTDLVERSLKTKDDRTGLHQAVEILKEAMPINVQNVADYLYTESSQEVWDLHKDFPNIAPPWPVAFFTWRQPRVYNSGGKIVTFTREQLPFDTDMGVLMAAIDCDDDPERPASLPDVKWRIQSLVFMRAVGGGWNTIAFRELRFFVTGAGEWLSLRPETDKRYHFLGTPFCLWPDGDPLGKNDAANRHEPHLDLYAPFLAISFAHCKNVMIDRAAVPGKLLKKRIRSHGWSPDAWHELRIQPMQKVLKDTGATTLQRALHICRGHFKDYREGRGLFGKVHGMFWWDFRLTDPSHPHGYTVRKPQ